MFRFYESMPNQGFVITFVVWWYYYNVYAQYAATFFLALTRFTAVLYPMRHERVRVRTHFVLASALDMEHAHLHCLCSDSNATAAYHLVYLDERS